MAVPAPGSSGLDTSDLVTAGLARGSFGSAPSSMSGGADASASISFDGLGPGMREAVSPAADLRRRLDAPASGTLPDDVALGLLRGASSQSSTFFESFVHRAWDRSYRAVHNEHWDGSLYTQDVYRNRSKIWKPKTLSALRKQLATTAKALFTTGDVVSVLAENDTDPRQVAAAAVKQELVNYRLGTSTHRNGIPWFLTAMGARYDAQVTNLCASKQSWLFEEIDVGDAETVETTDGEIEHRPGKRIMVDRPDIRLFPPENVRFDQNASWTNVAQLSPFLLLRYPMTVDEAASLIARNGRGKTPWRAVDRGTLKGLLGGDATETISARSARGAGTDPQQQASGAYRRMWLTECYFRHEGQDWTFWTANDQVLLSDPVPTIDAHPWANGERPVVIGKGQLEPHRTFGMSAVESWQQAQQEINDLANLRLDHLKQIVAPPTKVKRGQQVDLAAVQRKAQNSLLLVKDMADVEPMALPDVPGGAFQESSLLTADLDDLAGNFDAGSVQSNRDLNETVGGMHLLSESSNQVSDFDLSVWAETWLQPIIAQLLKLEEHYEDDRTVLDIAGQRASLWDKHGIGGVTDDLLAGEATVRVNVGVGATSLPMEKIKRFSMAYDTVAKCFAPFVQTGKIEVELNAEGILGMVFGAAGFKDAGAGLFAYVGPPRQPPAPPPPDPKLQVAQINAQSRSETNQVALERNRSQAALSAAKLQNDRTMQHANLLNDAADRRAGVDIAHLKAVAESQRAHAGRIADAAAMGHAHAHEHLRAHADTLLGALDQHLAPLDPAKTANSPHGDPSKPLLAPKPSPHAQPQPGMYATLERGLLG